MLFFVNHNYLRLLGYHEAGHYIVAKVLGFKTGSLKLKIIDLNGTHVGSSEIELSQQLYGVNDILSYLEARVQILYAGALAESLSTNGEINECLAVKSLENGGSQDDFRKVHDFTHLIRNIRFPSSVEEEDISKELHDISGELWIKTKNIIIEEHTYICSLGERIASRIKVAGVEIKLSQTELESLPALKSRFS